MKSKKTLIFILIFMIFLLSACAETEIPEEVEYSYDLSDDFFLYETNDGIITIALRDDSVDDEAPKIILENVSKLAFNDNFIIAEQIEIIQLGKEEKEVYWIINSNTKEIYGPTEYKEFNDLKEELNIDKDLELKSPEEYN